jgi:hypothetical protein
MGNNVFGDIDTDGGEDLEGPTITHEAIAEPQPFGQDVLIEASVADPSGVVSVEVAYQQETAVLWTSRTLVSVSDELYQGTIPSADIGSAQMRYFVQAWDDLDNAACSPDDCEADPYEFSIVP